MWMLEKTKSADSASYMKSAAPPQSVGNFISFRNYGVPDFEVVPHRGAL